MDTECTGRRINDKITLINETKAWCKERNKNKSKINWNFTKKTQTKNYLNTTLRTNNAKLNCHDTRYCRTYICLYKHKV